MSAHASATPITSAGEAEQVLETLNAITGQLTDAIAKETAHVRAGRIGEATKLGETKAELGRRYEAESARIIVSRKLIARSMPQAFAALRERHMAFQTLLKTNMTVLATAQAVSEGILRGVSGELARKRAPSTYGSTGRAIAPSPKANQPIAISRTL